MYAVKICIYTDDDFGYEEPEFDLKDDEEKTFYFENRKDAADALVRSFHNLKKSLRPHGRDYIKKWIDSMDKKIELIAEKIPTFIIDKDFGNQSILYELLEVNKVKMDNGSYCYNSFDSEIDFSYYEPEEIDWNELANSPDVEV